jgi:methylated-DNA-[protein]-cysteine S-methyltransferase
MASRIMSQCFVQGPVGTLQLVASPEGLSGVYFQDHRHMPAFEAEPADDHLILRSARRELSEYFAGQRCVFETPLAPEGTRAGTAFQRTVWQALRSIPCGQTWSYSELARFIGNPSAARAVGAANGKNALSIFVPCHRVSGASGSLTGYAGGLAWKRWLLEHEANAWPHAAKPTTARRSTGLRARADLSLNAV